MAKGRATPVPYTQSPQPIIDAGIGVYIQRELKAIETALGGAQDLAVYAVSVPPRKPLDGMCRLARWPWWPVTGQAADAWVYYDATGAVWRLYGTAPTSSH